MGRPGEPRSLPWTDGWLLVTAAALLSASRLALLLVRPATAGRLVDRAAALFPPRRVVEDPDRIAAAVRTAGRRLPVAPACLGHAVVARAMLAAHGHRSELTIGVAKNGRDDLEAHAWVERDGRVLVGDIPDLARFRRLSTDGRDGRRVKWGATSGDGRTAIEARGPIDP